MPFWSDSKWRSVLGTATIIEPYDASALEESKYLLSVGDEIYISSPEERSTIKRFETKQPGLSIDPGQFAFLSTAETVKIPFDAIGFISIRASTKFLGLVNISGFHVDPGYHGKLIFAVFNAGPARVHVKRGDKIFSIWLADLDQQISQPNVSHGYDGIPSKLVNQISGDFTTAYQLKKKVDELREDVTKLKAFRLYLIAIVGFFVFIFANVIKDRLSDLFKDSPKPSVQSTTSAPE